MLLIKEKILIQKNYYYKWLVQFKKLGKEEFNFFSIILN